MQMNLNETVYGYLKEISPERVTARQIAIWICENRRDACEAKMERSQATVTPIDNWAALQQQLVAEIGSQRPRLESRYPDLSVTEGRPRLYFVSDAAEEQAPSKNGNHETHIDVVSQPTLGEGKPKLTEHDLYPTLSEYLLEEMGVFSIRIDEATSSNSRGQGGNSWLHPDIVGMQAQTLEWEQEVRTCFSQFGDNPVQLWSFEVKLQLTTGNVRQAFFQAVSNSSWANYGYLVASEIVGSKTMEELRMLCSLHGIGLMNLDAGSPSDSQILIPAQAKPRADWASINRLAAENRDFCDYVRQIRTFLQTEYLDRSSWFEPHAAMKS
jgi:hypothetical protein